ncbi:MAG TPA: peptidoglycan bridge formation glycyltransferase FemA/FemB family protein [bacterium]|nr:peptidoglycan bridge formation glycyltransferase FemA/FemB family protein [bacterium]
MEPLVDRDFPGFRAGSYKRFIEPSTVRIDLSGTEEEILSSMHQKGRYNIRLAERAGVIVESVPPTDENLTTFHSLFLETTDRDGFSGAGRGYFAELSRYLAATGEGEMLFARMDERIVAAGIFVHHFRSALYYYGASASDPEVRRAMPTYALQWAAIRRAKSLGCAVYDFLGIEPEEGGDGHLAGVTQFKRRFVPHDTTVWPEARIWIPRPFIYAILRLARTLKKCLRKKA